MEEEQVSTNFLIFSQSFVASLLWHQRQKQVERASPLQIWMTEFSHLYSHHLCDFTQYLPLPLTTLAGGGNMPVYDLEQCLFLFRAKYFQTQKLHVDTLYDSI